jgi:hypothetical protein
VILGTYSGSNRNNAEYLVTFEVFRAMAMKNAFIWDVKTQFVLHKKHITYPLQSPVG